MLQIKSAFFCSNLFAQGAVTTSELGFGIGGANYTGELAPEYRFLNNQPALTVFYRRDFTAPITLRAGMFGSHRIVNDNTIGDHSYNLPLPNYRQAEMRLSLLELSGVVEYNFLDYYDPAQAVRFSPYFFLGLAGTFYNVQTRFDNAALKNSLEEPYRTTLTFAIPIGVGIKYGLSKHWNLGVEFGARKLLNDRIDNLRGQDKRISNPFDKDWYYYNGISLSYTFYKINCPPVYRLKPGLLD
ncbi:type IX secretion system protein PorG [Botryobacter ruber]|uniref:type IX secretion system protein PorG n=1 Tax=Botryobacter ruber TaxID=2171629 RepID=UPI001F0C5608|nr:DUF6089 family protein [Botryobacter ruber]